MWKRPTRKGAKLSRFSASQSTAGSHTRFSGGGASPTARATPATAATSAASLSALVP